MKKYLVLLFFFIQPLHASDDDPPAEHVNFGITDLAAGMVSYPAANKIPDNAANYIQNFFTDIQPLAVERNGTTREESTVLGGTAAITGLWDFIDVNNVEWLIAFSSKTFYKKQVGGTFASFGFQQTVTQAPVATINLGRIWFVDGTDDLWSFDGTTSTQIASAPIATLITSWRNRLCISGIGASNNHTLLYFSADGDGTNWTLGGGDADPFTTPIAGANDGYDVKCIYGMYQDILIVGRKFDLWGIYGFGQSTEQTRKLSSEVGCIQDNTMRETDGDLIWLSNRGIEKMNGSDIQLISDPIRNLTDVVVKNTVNQRSNTQTTQADFQAGSQSPVGWISTADASGVVSLATQPSNGNFLNSVSTDFAAGTLVNLTTATPNTVSLSLSSTSIFNQQYGADSTDILGFGNTGGIFQSFTANSNYVLTGLTLRLHKSGSPVNTTVNVMSDNAGTPGTILGTFNLSNSTVTASVDDITVNGTAISISSGSRYWIELVDAANASNGTDYLWVGTTGSFSEFLTSSNSIRPFNKSTTTNAKYKTIGQTYVTSGIFTSQIFDVGFSSTSWLPVWGNFISSNTVPAGTTLNFYVKTATSATGIFSSTQVAISGSQISANNQEFIQYIASFTTTNTGFSPVLNSVQLNVAALIRPAAVFTSQLLIIGPSISSWQPVNILDAGTIGYQFGSTNTASVSAISNWANIVNGGVPTVPTNSYAAFRASFTAVNSTTPMRLSEFDTHWSEGSSPINMSWTWDRRYWMAFTTSTASSNYLDTVLVYQRNKTWTLLKGINAASFTRWRDNLYFGDSTGNTGLVYQYDVGNNDDGQPISSMIRTKSYDLGVPYRAKDFKRVYVGVLNSAYFSGSYSVMYDIDRMGNNFSLGSANLNDSTGEVEDRFPFNLGDAAPEQGREIQYTLTKSGTGDRLELYEFRTMYFLKSYPKD